MNSVYTLSPYFPKIHSKIIFPPTPKFVCISHRSHACYMPHLSHPHRFDHPNNMCWTVQVMKFLIMQSSPVSHHFFPLRSKYFPQYPLLLNNFCRILTMVFWYWTNCTFGLYPSSGVSKNWGIQNIYQISQYTRPQNSHKCQLLTTEPLTWVHTHINPWSKSDTVGNKWPSHCILHSY
jgi:hypothetical protein